LNRYRLLLNRGGSLPDYVDYNVRL